jgi:hypothetical protein
MSRGQNFQGLRNESERLGLDSTFKYIYGHKYNMKD